jgi:hypothetical protein
MAHLVEALAATATVEAPRSYASALKGEHRSDWIKATEAEIKNYQSPQVATQPTKTKMRNRTRLLA